ncbi:MAG: Tab2/Atab2 family RNA-binding protein [Leptolyngbyaceae cyanobacterium bins.302]|nr:Tab2/Atab2 family RNA-binding protein [Leptolyngbyaceae cyanobacterium bins.302]
MTKIWELDFYSRPILDENGKKVWEVLICESPTTINTELAPLFRYAEYCSNSEVNSARLMQVLKAAIAEAGATPDRIRFFRQAMKNMIAKACNDLGIPAVMSRRTYALNRWMQQRMQEDYPQHPGFQPGTNPSVSFAATAAQRLPDALQGQKWAFVSLETNAFDDMAEWAIDFGEAFPLALTSVQPDTLIPGLVIFSPRAIPMAGWMSGLELGFLTVDAETPRLMLETGVNDRWVLANLNNPQLLAEAQQFEAAKQQANGVHFLAVQTNPETEAFAGFWLLQETVLA